KALGYVVLNPYCFIQHLVFHDIQYRSKRLRLHNPEIRRHCRYAWPHITSGTVFFPFKHSSFDYKFPALAFTLGYCRQICVHSVFINQRSDMSPFIQRISDSELPVCTDQPRYEGLIHESMEKNTARRGPALTRRTDGSEYRRGQRHVKVCARADDNCIIAAQFQDALA